MTLSASAELCTMSRMPWAMERTPTSTATTPAIPKTADSAVPSRSGSDWRLKRVMAKTWMNQLIIVYLRSASAMRRRWAWSEGKIPAAIPTTSTSPMPMARSSRGK
jgi:hypothetical protein